MLERNTVFLEEIRVLKGSSQLIGWHLYKAGTTFVTLGEN